MISAFKRLVHTNNGQTISDKLNDDKKRLSAGVLPMDSSLQKKFSKGVQYNMRIIIRGDKNVGKTCLFSRLQGDQFKEDYLPTEEIQVTNIEWNYNVTDDKVKVEVWEICDISSKKRKPVNELKLNEKKNSKSPVQPEEANELGLDAQFIDVYKNTNGVIMMFDLTKNWTFEYIEKEIENIPKNIPIIILGNHIDQSHHGLPINKDKVKCFIETVERESSGQIRYAETSMRNGFGLKFLYKWFNLPFLHLKKQTLLKQIQVNEREIDACCLELGAIEESDDQNYERFLYTIQNRRREIADKLSQVPKSTKSENNLVSKSVPFNLAGAASNGNMTANQMIKPTPSIIIGANNPLPIPKNYTTATRSTSMTINASNKDEKLDIENETEDQAKLRQFLEDAIEVREELIKQPPVILEDSDNEELDQQPKILSYQDELDPEDCIEGPPSSILIEEVKSISIESSKEPDTKNDLSTNDVNVSNDMNVSNDQPNDTEKEESKKTNGHHKERKSFKKESNKISINLVDSLPDKSILEKSSRTKKSKKSKKSSSDKERSSKKKSLNLEELLGQPYVAPLDEGPTEGEEYFEL